MVRIGDLNLYVGTKEEYLQAKLQGMRIVCALNRANAFVTHQSVVGWSGRGCDKRNPYYLFKEEQDAIYLNMIDGDDPNYVSDKMIDSALSFIKKHIDNNDNVFIYCSLGESRSPSIALMYLLEYGLLAKENALYEFRKMYPNYNPKAGNWLYIQNRWLLK